MRYHGVWEKQKVSNCLAKKDRLEKNASLGLDYSSHRIEGCGFDVSQRSELQASLRPVALLQVI